MGTKELGRLKDIWIENGGHWQDYVIWIKSHFTLSRSDYQHIYEPIMYGWPKGIVNHYFNKSRDIADAWDDIRNLKTVYDGKHTIVKFQGFEVKIEGEVQGTVRRKKQITNIWRYDKPTVSAEHPTMKPIGLCAEAIKNSSRIGEIVLDLFAGSGSTLIAAERMNRACYAMELDPRFVDVIINRWEEATGGKANKLIL